MVLVCVTATNDAGSQPQSPGVDQTVRIGVLSLFRPNELRLQAVSGESLVLNLDGQSSSLPNNIHSLEIHAENGRVHLQVGEEMKTMTGTPLRICGRSNRAGSDTSRFWLEVPGKLRRLYAGTLEVRARGSILEAVVTMQLETAVASIVDAESPRGAGMEALKAQAVAVRSFLMARQSSHIGFDFCDTTHCQFLRSPPAAGSQAGKTAQATQGLILTWHEPGTGRDRTVPAMYARSCGGRTRTLREIGAWSNDRNNGYPYYAVDCAYCTRHPEVWQREADGLSKPDSETGRLAYNRIHGWGAIPSLPGSAPDRSAGIIVGRGIGHGLGLCQLGGASMARHGASFAQILAHYYPNTRLTAMP
jgi:stage II sporulation protein D